MRARWLAIALTAAALAVVPPLAAGASRAPTSALAAHAQPANQAPTTSPLAATAQPASVVAMAKFVFHAGLAFGAFHHFIYLPFKAGKFTHGGIFSKLKTYAEGALAGLFVYHEAKLALQDAQQNKVLKLLVSPLTAVVGAFNAIASKIRSHSLDATTVSQAQSSVASIESGAKQAGSTVTEAIPTAKQLAAGSA